MRPKIGTPESVRKHYRERDRVIRAMGFPSYRAFLSSAFWRALRADVIAGAEGCEVCGDDVSEVHHKSYSRAVLEGKKPGQLSPLCAAHHHAIEFDGWGRKRSPITAAKRLKQLIAERR